MDAGVAVGLIGVDYSASSIIIVYHLFALQQWLQAAERLLDDAGRLSLGTGVESIERQDLASRCVEQRRRFPWLQASILGCGIVALNVLAICAGLAISHEVPPYFTSSPSIVLLLTPIAASVVIRRAGKRALDRARGYLGVVAPQSNRE